MCLCTHTYTQQRSQVSRDVGAPSLSKHVHSFSRESLLKRAFSLL